MENVSTLLPAEAEGFVQWPCDLTRVYLPEPPLELRAPLMLHPT